MPEDYVPQEQYEAQILQRINNKLEEAGASSLNSIPEPETLNDADIENPAEHLKFYNKIAKIQEERYTDILDTDERISQTRLEIADSLNGGAPYTNQMTGEVNQIIDQFNEQNKAENHFFGGRPERRMRQAGYADDPMPRGQQLEILQQFGEMQEKSAEQLQNAKERIDYDRQQMEAAVTRLEARPTGLANLATGSASQSSTAAMDDDYDSELDHLATTQGSKRAAQNSGLDALAALMDQEDQLDRATDRAVSAGRDEIDIDQGGDLSQLEPPAKRAKASPQEMETDNSPTPAAAHMEDDFLGGISDDAMNAAFDDLERKKEAPQSARSEPNIDGDHEIDDLVKAFERLDATLSDKGSVHASGEEASSYGPELADRPNDRIQGRS